MKVLLHTVFAISLLFAMGCVSVSDSDDGNGDFNSSDGSGLGTGNNGSGGNSGGGTNDSTSDWKPPENSLVYVSTADVLYVIDPADSSNLQEIGPFTGDCTSDAGFYDLALDEDRNLVGISLKGIYAIDKETAHCELIFAFPPNAPHFFSLSYVKGVLPDHPDRDCLMAASGEDGEWVMIDFNGEGLTDVFVHIGYYDYPEFKYVSSGDIVSVEMGPGVYKTYATLRCSKEHQDEPNCETDWLAEIDPQTGDARLIGQTGFKDIYGLGFWGDKIYGFTLEGEYILIDTETGAATLVQKFPDIEFWGAGTTTKPYVVQ